MNHIASFTVRVAALLLLLTSTALAQYPWGVTHTVTGTTSAALTVIGKSGSAYTTRVTSIVVCGSQAGTYTIELGGTAPTGTLSTAFPWYTKTAHANIFPAYSDWPFSVYTASDATGGKVIGKVVLAASGCTGFNGLSVDKRYWTMELQKNSAQFYTVRATQDSSGNVTFSLNGEVVK